MPMGAYLGHYGIIAVEYIHVHVGWGRERGTLESILLLFNGKFMWHECAPVFMCHTCVIGIDVQGT